MFSQRHQLSYTVPYSFVESGGHSANGVGDVLLNYRLQALFETDALPAFAPRVSLILPTGDESEGFGNDTLGYQFNLPLSKIIHDRWTAHVNAGLTVFPDLNDRNPVTYHTGGSLIYAANEHLNFMLELLGQWTEDVQAGGAIDREFEAIVSPGIRYGFDIGESQLVLGIGAPVGLSGAAADYGVFLYVSFEHGFLPTD